MLFLPKDEIVCKVRPHAHCHAVRVEQAGDRRGVGAPGREVTVAPPGVDPSVTPGGERSPDPLVVAAGRLDPIKQYDRLIAVLGALREHHPGLRAVIVGEGDLRPELEAQRRALGADDWIDLPGRVTHDVLLDLYRRAWVVASPSAREGWGMTLTEAGQAFHEHCLRIQAEVEDAEAAVSRIRGTPRGLGKHVGEAASRLAKSA